ncbi:hypothetical protein MY10362_009396, partial [Beauveria mimosiformis]
MPSFQSRREAPTEPAATEAALKKPGFFHSRRESSPARTISTTTTSSGDGSPSLLHKGLYKMGTGGGDRDLDDPSILRAREHVMGAEAAEEEADRALDAARRRVREAREHVRRLEEAEADARRARIKQHHAAEVSKRGKVLG